MFLLISLNIFGCSKIKPFLPQIFGEGNVNKACVLHMPYAIYTNDEGLLLSPKEENLFGRGMSLSFGENIVEKEKVKIRKPNAKIRPERSCGKSDTGYIPSEYNYRECIQLWAKKIFDQNRNLCPLQSTLVIMGAQVDRYMDEPIEITTLVVIDEKVYESEPISISASHIKQKIAERNFLDLGSKVGKTLAKMFNKNINFSKGFTVNDCEIKKAAEEQGWGINFTWPEKCP